MRRVIFSDLHGADRALESLLERESGTVISAGDVLGRAGSNQRCLDLLRKRGIVSVQGNHEARMLKGYAAGLEDWCLDWIRSWPIELQDDDTLVTHTLFENHDFLDIDLAEHAQRLLSRRPLVFVGHHHQPGYWMQTAQSLPKWTAVIEPRVLELQPGCRYLIQIGSLGEPLAPSLPRYVGWTEEFVEWC